MSGFVFLRVRAHRLLLVAALLAVLLTTSVLATLTGFSGAIGDAALRHSLTHRSAAPASLVVKSSTAHAERAEAEEKVAAGAREVFDGLPVFWRTAERSGTYALPRSLQAPGARSGDPYLTHLAALDRSRLELAEGSWPVAPGSGNIQVALPEAAAKELKLSPGGPPLELTDRLSGPPVTVEVTGIYRPLDTTDPYWLTDTLNGRGLHKVDFTTYGPMLTDPAVFTEGKVSAGDISWLVTGDFSGVGTDRIAALRAAAEHGTEQLRKAGFSASTQLPELLERSERALLVSRSTLLIVALQLLMLAGYALLLVARLLSSERAGETDLLMARGGSRGQVAKFAAAESLLLAVPAAVFAPLLVGPLTELLAGQGALARIGLDLDTSPTFQVWLVALLVSLGCAAAVVAPALSFTGLRRSVRMKALPAPVRAGADIGLLVIAGVAYWQLDRQTSGGALTGDSSGELGIDPLLVGAPALALLAGTVLTLRLLPPAAKLGERRAAKGRGLPGALAGWQLSRRPLRGAGPVLLLVLAVAMGMLAIGHSSSWDRSQEDQADFRTGTQVRVQGGRISGPEQSSVYASVPGVRAAAPAVRTTMELPGRQTADLLALDIRDAADGMLLREDLGNGGELRGALKADSTTSYGMKIPEKARKLEFVLRVSTEETTTAAPATVSALLRDRHDGAHSVTLGTLPADGEPHTLTAELGAAGPYTLTGFEVLAPPSAQKAEAHELSVVEVRADGNTVTVPRTLRWEGSLRTVTRPSAPAQDEKPVELAISTATDALLTSTYQTARKWPDSDDVFTRQLLITAAQPKAPMPSAVVTERFLDASGAHRGDEIDLPLAREPLRVRIAKVVPELPTSFGSGGAVLVDLRAVNSSLAQEHLAELPPNEWWLTTDPAQAGQVAAALRARPDLDPEQVLVRPEAAEQLRDDPLGAGPQSALLAVAAVAAALAAVGFAVSAAGSLRERAAEFSVLRALGTPQRELARLVTAEQGVLIGVSLMAGLALGAVLTRAVLPLIVLTADAGKPVPPVLVELPVGRMALLLVTVAAVPMLVVAAIALRRVDPVVSLRHEGGN
ncbi:FtsX-like permease family protein [Streptomyces sp. KLOTTS4A1]|uniref:ABC transporter permease n=1 Tax=Streptomyces sp. KLOTTS4A1 TaxID=3390996 RepID=UPI0039F4F17A